jgi:sodium/proline symporter
MHNTAIASSFVIYIIFVLIIGIIAYRQTRDFSDYILGGRRLGAWVAALSAGASDMSGWLLLGFPGEVYRSGLQAVWIGIGLLIGTWMNWRFVALRLRIYSEVADNSLTLPAFFQGRFLDHGLAIRITAAMLILLFYMIYIASGLVAGAKLFNAVFSIDYHYALFIGVALILVYTFIGGFLAVSWTDLFQGLLMLFALIIVPLMIVYELGGFTQTYHAMQQYPQMFTLLGGGDEFTQYMGLVSALAWGLGYFGQPHILARFKAVSSSQLIAPARRIAVSWTFLSLLGAFLVGFIGLAFLGDQDTVKDNEQIFLILVNRMFIPVIAGICLAAVLAAVMSTADSQLLVSASVLTEDIYKVINRHPTSENRLIWYGRFAVLVISIVAIIIAWNKDATVLGLVGVAWAGFGAAFGSVLLISLYWRRMNYQGAIAGMVTGAVTVVLWKIFKQDLVDLYEIIPGFILACVAIILVSVLTTPPGDRVVQRFNQVRYRA